MGVPHKILALPLLGKRLSPHDLKMSCMTIPGGQLERASTRKMDSDLHFLLL